MPSRVTVKALQVEMQEAIAEKDAIIEELLSRMDDMEYRMAEMQKLLTEAIADVFKHNRELGEARRANTQTSPSARQAAPRPQQRVNRSAAMERARKEAMESGKTVTVS